MKFINEPNYNNLSILYNKSKMSNSITQKRDAYKVEIRRKRVEDKIAQMRAVFMLKLQSDSG